jgi:hypothetical protein
MLRNLLLLFSALMLVACSGPSLPFEKDLPAQSSIVNPPWEALVQAGPGAENELDLETLNGPDAAVPPPPLIAEAEAAGQDQVEPLPAPKKPDKNAVAIKAVAVPSVQGAAGQGNAELTQAMREVLRNAGWPVVNAPNASALTIRGKVKSVRTGAVETVQLAWVVTTPDGKTLGDISQSNEVPAGSLDKGWGENARLATEAAATGIFKLIQNYR